MKHIGLALITIFLAFTPCRASILENAENFPGENGTTIYKFQIPDDKDEEQTENNTVEPEDIISDDVTADTTPVINQDNSDSNKNEDDDYLISDMYTDVLKGYAEYNVEDEEGIKLEIPELNVITYNIKRPTSVAVQNYSYLKITPLFKHNEYSKHNLSEYNITPLYGQKAKQIGPFSAGTTFSQYIDTGELESSSGIFSRYQYKNFALTTTYTRTLSSRDNSYSDNFYLSPEYKINQYFTVREKLSANPITKKKKAEFILSINPLGNKDNDRLRLDLGASQSYDEENNLFKSQFKFYTTFKL